MISSDAAVGGKQEYEILYDAALKCKKEHRLDDAIALFEKASSGKKVWIINDYALCLIERNAGDDFSKAEKLLIDYCRRGNSQSIRLLGLMKTKKHEYVDQCIGELLLKYSIELGNKWSFNDYFNICKERDLSSDMDYLYDQYCNNKQLSNNDVLNIFRYVSGTYDNSMCLDKMQKMYGDSVSDLNLHIEELKILIKTNNKKLRDVIIQDPMVETPEYAFELAKIYRDGIIVSKSLAMYKKIYNKLPKQMQVDLEEDR